MYLSLSLSLCLSFCWSSLVFSSLWWNVSKVNSLKDWSLKVFSKCLCHWLCLCHCHCHCHYLCGCHCLFVGQFMFYHHSHQMSQRSKVSNIALWRCSLNVSVNVFVIVVLLVRSCFLMIPISFARFRFGLEDRKALNPDRWVSEWPS